MTGRPIQPRQKFNSKRQMQETCDAAELDSLALCVEYGGNSAHKRDPGDFDLLPPAQPRPDETLCDAAGITTRAEALQLLREGVSRGLISRQTRGDFPQNVWAVTKEGFPMEAQLDNQVQGTYHGYPMPSTDDFRDEVLKRWNQL